MSLVLQFATGARAGQRETLAIPVVVAGRHPDSDLRFDAHQDLDVSTRHAEFRHDPTGWTVRDLGSTNGTFVNGKRIAAPTAVRAGDVIGFGADGPKVKVVEATGAGGVASAAAAAAPRTIMRDSASARSSTQERVAIAVARETRSIRTFVVALAVVVVGGVGALVWMSQRQSAQLRNTINDLLARSDSLSSALQGAMGDAALRQAGFDSLARELQRDRTRLEAALTRTRETGGDVQAIASQLDALDRRTGQALNLAGDNHRKIVADNAPAVAYLVVEFQDGNSFEGTAFGITSDGLLVTNKHNVIDREGRPARRLGVEYSGTGTFRPATVVRVVDSADVAIIRFTDGGPLPVVSGVTRSTGVAAGDAITVIGYPLGRSLAGRNRPKVPTSTFGQVTKVEPGQISITAYAAQGSSGSPVFNARGDVIGILYGAATESNGQIIVLVPSDVLIANLLPNERAAVR